MIPGEKIVVGCNVSSVPAAAEQALDAIATAGAGDERKQLGLSCRRRDDDLELRRFQPGAQTYDIVGFVGYWAAR